MLKPKAYLVSKKHGIVCIGSMLYNVAKDEARPVNREYLPASLQKKLPAVQVERNCMAEARKAYQILTA